SMLLSGACSPASGPDPVKKGSDGGVGRLDGAPDSKADVSVRPTLASLEVSALDDASPIGLAPAFSSAVFDYYVRCAAGTNQLAVSMTASPGAFSALTLPTTSPSAAQQTLSPLA